MVLDKIVFNVDFETGFNADEFSKALLTKEGIEELLRKDPAYLIFYADKVDLDGLSRKYSWVKDATSDAYSSVGPIVNFFESNFGVLVYEVDEVYVSVRTLV